MSTPTKDQVARENVLFLHDNGVSRSEIARRVGVSETYVRDMIWKERPKRAQPDPH